MKAHLDLQGQLLLTAETETEAYGLSQWASSSVVKSIYVRYGPAQREYDNFVYKADVKVEGGPNASTDRT